MKVISIAAGVAGLTLATSAWSQQPPPRTKFAPGEVFSPNSDHLLPNSASRHAHTNLRVLIPVGQPRVIPKTSGVGATTNAPPVTGAATRGPASRQERRARVA